MGAPFEDPTQPDAVGPWRAWPLGGVGVALGPPKETGPPAGLHTCKVSPSNRGSVTTTESDRARTGDRAVSGRRRGAPRGRLPAGRMQDAR